MLAQEVRRKLKQCQARVERNCGSWRKALSAVKGMLLRRQRGMKTRRRYSCRSLGEVYQTEYLKFYSLEAQTPGPTSIGSPGTYNWALNPLISQIALETALEPLAGHTSDSNLIELGQDRARQGRIRCDQPPRLFSNP